MSLALTTQAVSLALDVAEARAETAGRNIAKAPMGGMTVRPDFSAALSALREAAADPSMSAAHLQTLGRSAMRTAREPALSGDAVDLDREVSDLALATLDYRALTEGLNRQFGLMRLAIGGK